MTVRLPRPFTSEDLFNYIQRLVEVLERTVDTVADNSVFTRKLARGAASGSSKTINTGSSVTLSVGGGPVTLGTYNLELIGFTDTVIYNLLGFKIDSSGSGEDRFTVVNIIELFDVDGNLLTTINTVQDFYLKAGELGFNLMLPASFASSQLPAGVTTIAIAANVNKVSSGNVTVDSATVEFTVSYAIEYRR